jgi:hypothetical protein
MTSRADEVLAALTGLPIDKDFARNLILTEIAISLAILVDTLRDKTP